MNKILAPVTWWRKKHTYYEFKAHPYKKDVILGYWAEDFTEYEISVPYQLRDIFIWILNNFSLPRKKRIDSQI